MPNVAIVAMGLSAHNYLRTVEQSGNRKAMYDEVWMVNGFGHVFHYDRLFAMDDIRMQALRGKNGNNKIGRLVEFLRTAKGPIYTSRCLAKEPPSEQMLTELKKVVDLLPQPHADYQGPPTEREIREAELRSLAIERELVLGGGFEGLVEFPMQDVIENFRCHPYFNNTVAYAIALAAHENRDMTIYGADFEGTMGTANAVERGRACCEFWISQAVSRGLMVDITLDSSLLDANRPANPYGYDGRDMLGQVGTDGKVQIQFTDRPLPDAMMVERAYYKGPPHLFEKHLADLRAA